MTDKERLTNPHSHILTNQDILHSGKEEVLWDGVYSKDVLEEMVERLAEYEDTGLSPAEIERLQSENTRLKAEVNQYKEFKNYFDSLYGQGLEVANWHLNGSLEPFDNFFDSAVDEMEREQG